MLCNVQAVRQLGQNSVLYAACIRVCCALCMCALGINTHLLNLSLSLICLLLTRGIKKQKRAV